MDDWRDRFGVLRSLSFYDFFVHYAVPGVTNGRRRSQITIFFYNIQTINHRKNGDVIIHLAIVGTFVDTAAVASQVCEYPTGNGSL